MLGEQRPQFNTEEEYIEHVQNALANGRTPWEPVTGSELQAVVEHFPDYAKRWLPSPRDLELLGLPPHLGRDVEPFGELWRERFLVTLTSDEELRLALAHLVSGRARQ